MPRWLGLTALSTLIGGILLSGLSFFLMKNVDLAIGAFLGAILSVLNLFAMNRLSLQVLMNGEKKSRKLFVFSNLLRWGFIGLACWALLKISVACLIGAIISNLGSLVALIWVSRSLAASSSPE
jgi:uncharacterized membrane protein